MTHLRYEVLYPIFRFKAHDPLLSNNFESAQPELPQVDFEDLLGVVRSSVVAGDTKIVISIYVGPEECFQDPPEMDLSCGDICGRTPITRVCP